MGTIKNIFPVFWHFTTIIFLPKAWHRKFCVTITPYDCILLLQFSRVSHGLIDVSDYLIHKSWSNFMTTNTSLMILRIITHLEWCFYYYGHSAHLNSFHLILLTIKCLKSICLCLVEQVQNNCCMNNMMLREGSSITSIL